MTSVFRILVATDGRTEVITVVGDNRTGEIMQIVHGHMTNALKATADINGRMRTISSDNQNMIDVWTQMSNVIQEADRRTKNIDSETRAKKYRTPPSTSETSASRTRRWNISDAFRHWKRGLRKTGTNSNGSESTNGCRFDMTNGY